MKKELLHENNLASTWLGDIKKEFQREQTRLRKEGVQVRFKPVWQKIVGGMHSAVLRREEIKKLKD